MNKQQFITNVLANLGASDSEITELLGYNHNMFDHSSYNLPSSFPPAAEAHISTWEQYVKQTERESVAQALQQHLVQFQFPILAGISETEEYRTATRQGKPTDGIKNATGLVFIAPEKLQIQLHQSIAGTIPVLIAGNREDFVTLVQALTKRNEPQPIPDSMGACIVSGYNNWHRIQKYRQKFSDEDWLLEFKKLIPQKELYQDRFIILSSGAYSNVAASSLKLTESEWQKLSLKIRLEHECTHYFTRRFLGSMQNNLLDELIADYRGIKAAIGYYRADWFLHFLGLESFPVYREGGRLQNYHGSPVSAGALIILAEIVQKAATNLEAWDKQSANKSINYLEEVSILLALTTLTLVELASESALFLLKVAVNRQRQLLSAFYGENNQNLLPL